MPSFCAVFNTPPNLQVLLDALSSGGGGRPKFIGIKFCREWYANASEKEGRKGERKRERERERERERRKDE
jgi:hypothetical protein